MLHCTKRALGRVPYCGSWDDTDMAKCRKGYDRSQANYLIEVNCGMDGNNSLQPMRAAFRSTPFCSSTSRFLFYSVTRLFRHFSFNFEVVVVGRWGRILKVCIGPYLHDKNQATKRLSADVLSFWENAWRNSGTIATILTTLLRVFLSLSNIILKDKMTYSCIFYTPIIIVFPCYPNSHQFRN
jgi:hypothetical protein